MPGTDFVRESIFDFMLLTQGAIVADLSVLITPVEDYQLPPEALSSKLVNILYLCFCVSVIDNDHIM
jgi:hypothetical protein